MSLWTACILQELLRLVKWFLGGFSGSWETFGSGLFELEGWKMFGWEGGKAFVPPRLFCTRGLGEDFDGVAVLDEVATSDLLAAEAGGRPPDARSTAGGGEVFVDFLRDILDGCARLHG